MSCIVLKLLHVWFLLEVNSQLPRTAGVRAFVAEVDEVDDSPGRSSAPGDIQGLGLVLRIHLRQTVGQARVYFVKRLRVRDLRLDSETYTVERLTNRDH